MDNTFILILTSSLAAAALTKVADYILFNHNFRRDYYKKIIDKRMAAYELLDSVVSDLVQNVISENGKYKSIFYNYNCFSKFLLKLENAANNRIWYSRETGLKVCELMELLGRRYDEKKIKLDSKNIQYNEMGICTQDKINVFIKAIEDSFTKDLRELYKVKNFLSKM